MEMVNTVLTVLAVCAAVYFVWRTVRKQAKGSCGCGNGACKEGGKDCA